MTSFQEHAWRAWGGRTARRRLPARRREPCLQASLALWVVPRLPHTKPPATTGCTTLEDNVEAMTAAASPMPDSSRLWTSDGDRRRNVCRLPDARREYVVSRSCAHIRQHGPGSALIFSPPNLRVALASIPSFHPSPHRPSVSARRKLMTGFHPVGDTVGSRYAHREGGMRGGLRLSMNALPLRFPAACLSGIGGRKMRWTLWAYYNFVFLALRIKLVGWPHDVPFMNLSCITSLARISRIVALWETGEMHFAPVSDDEHRAALDHPESCAPGPLHFGFAPNLGRCDIKKRKYRPKKDPLNLRQGRYVRNGPKSARWVSQMAEARAAEGM